MHPFPVCWSVVITSGKRKTHIFSKIGGAKFRVRSLVFKVIDADKMLKPNFYLYGRSNHTLAAAR